MGLEGRPASTGNPDQWEEGSRGGFLWGTGGLLNIHFLLLEVYFHSKIKSKNGKAFDSSSPLPSTPSATSS